MTRKVSYIVGEIYFSCLPKLSYLEDQALAESAAYQLGMLTAVYRTA